MDEEYKPKKLIAVTRAIRREHPIQVIPPHINPNNELKTFIMRLVGTDPNRILICAMALTTDEVLMVAEYIPHNYYNVDMKNLFQIFELRSDNLVCKVLFAQWQQSYNNKECNEFLIGQLQTNESLLLLLLEYHMEAQLFRDILLADNICVRIGRECLDKKHYFEYGTSLKDRLNFFGIVEGTRLFEDCERFFYIYCRHEDYLTASDGDVLSAVKKYNKRLLGSFLSNFLGCMFLTELDRYRQLGRYFLDYYGDIESNHSQFVVPPFSYLSQTITDKYKTWINRIKINQLFGYDERSIFWRDYQFVHVRHYKHSNSLIMEFDDYVAIEFLGTAMGPIYIFQIDYYDKFVKTKLYNCSNTEARSLLLHDTNFLYRKIHQGSWQGDVNYYLLSKHITRRIS